jgi:hypothetical protein
LSCCTVVCVWVQGVAQSTKAANNTHTEKRFAQLSTLLKSGVPAKVPTLYACCSTSCHGMHQFEKILPVHVYEPVVSSLLVEVSPSHWPHITCVCLPAAMPVTKPSKVKRQKITIPGVGDRDQTWSRMGGRMVLCISHEPITATTTGLQW